MLEERLLRILINQIIKEENIKLRTSKGYGSSHPIINTKPLSGFGDMYQYKEKPKKKTKKLKQKIKISKAFDKDYLDDLNDYERIIKEILYGR